MDARNIRALKNRAVGEGEVSKIRLWTYYCHHFIEADCIPDPYYGGDAGFLHVIDLLEDACLGLLLEVKGECEDA